MSLLSSLDKAMPILVVDDYPTVRRVVRTCLKQLGFDNVIEAEDGSKALELLRAQPVQFIISDWSMPEMSGIDLLNAARADENLKKIPFLFVTAENQKHSIKEAPAAAQSEFVVKPFTSQVLQKKMEAIFQNR